MFNNTEYTELLSILDIKDKKINNLQEFATNLSNKIDQLTSEHLEARRIIGSIEYQQQRYNCIIEQKQSILNFLKDTDRCLIIKLCDKYSYLAEVTNMFEIIDFTNRDNHNLSIIKRESFNIPNKYSFSDCLLYILNNQKNDFNNILINLYDYITESKRYSIRTLNISYNVYSKKIAKVINKHNLNNKELLSDIMTLFDELYTKSHIIIEQQIENEQEDLTKIMLKFEKYNEKTRINLLKYNNKKVTYDWCDPYESDENEYYFSS